MRQSAKQVARRLVLAGQVLGARSCLLPIYFQKGGVASSVVASTPSIRRYTRLSPVRIVPPRPASRLAREMLISWMRPQLTSTESSAPLIIMSAIIMSARRLPFGHCQSDRLEDVDRRPLTYQIFPGRRTPERRIMWQSQNRREFSMSIGDHLAQLVLRVCSSSLDCAEFSLHEAARRSRIISSLSFHLLTPGRG